MMLFLVSNMPKSSLQKSCEFAALATETLLFFNHKHIIERKQAPAEKGQERETAEALCGADIR